MPGYAVCFQFPISSKLLLPKPVQGGCALFSWKRYKQGFESAFSDVPDGEYYQQSEPPFQPGKYCVLEMVLFDF